MSGGAVDESSLPAAKRLRREEPYLIVIVEGGGTEFHCYSQVLRYASDYFDATLRTVGAVLPFLSRGPIRGFVEEYKDYRHKCPEASPMGP